MENEEWHKIGNRLTSMFGICQCQRKLKTIINNLAEVYLKLEARDFSFTGAEWLLIAMLDRGSDAVTHGVNCEYPILNKESELWEFILEAKDSSYLQDN